MDSITILKSDIRGMGMVQVLIKKELEIMKSESDKLWTNAELYERMRSEFNIHPATARKYINALIDKGVLKKRKYGVPCQTVYSIV